MAGELLCNILDGELLQWRHGAWRHDADDQRVDFSLSLVATHYSPYGADDRAISQEQIMTMYQPEPNEAAQRAVVSAIHEHWVLFLVEGILLMLLGAAAIILPVIATLAFTLVIGWLFLLSGVIGLITTFWMRNAPGFWWSLLSAVIGIAAGIVLIRWPISGTVSLTLVLIAFFIIEGIVTLMYAFEHRAQLSGRWGWMLASGIVDLILAGIIFAGLPETATWALGLRVGINLLFGGPAMLGPACAVRSVELFACSPAHARGTGPRPFRDPSGFPRFRGNERITACCARYSPGSPLPTPDMHSWRGAGRRDRARLCSNQALDDFGRIAQSIAGEVGIALRGAGIGVPEQRLHHVERDALVNQKARKRVPQVVQPHIGQSRTRADPPPRKPQRRRRPAGNRGGEK